MFSRPVRVLRVLGSVSLPGTQYGAIRSFSSRFDYDGSAKEPVEFAKKWKESVEEVTKFWGEKAKDLTWFAPYDSVLSGTFEDGDVTWFRNGKINVAYNCVDRHLATKGEKPAIIWEGDEGETETVTYRHLYQEVCRYANLLREAGLKKGDTVSIYMPNCPEAVFAMLACARLGLVHSVVFAGFSSDALATRINDCKAKVLFTANEFHRGGRPVKLKPIVDEALRSCPTVKTVFVFKKTRDPFPLVAGRDVDLVEAASTQRPTCPVEWLDSEDPLFLLYTSGSTGSPKGLLHTQAGYLLFASLSHRVVFDLQPTDRFACMADVGWITGHSYIVYGPLANGATTFMFEGLPTYPDASRYWRMIERHRLTHLYTAPTAIRALMKFGDEPTKGYDLSSLRILGSVGEPINPEAWKWYHKVGKGRPIMDTYWQTESGGVLLTPRPGTPLKAGSAATPFLGVKTELLDEKGQVIYGAGKGVLVVTAPWPGIARTVYNNHSRYLNTYFGTYRGIYFTGDGARRDEDGYYWIEGRVDDVIGVAGHRLGTAEIESALVASPACAEAAVVGVPHETKGQAVFAYCVLREGYLPTPQLEVELRSEVRHRLGAFAAPERVVLVPGLPKTRSGKIMRRILRKVAVGEISDLGDTSTLAEPGIVQLIIAAVANKAPK